MIVMIFPFPGHHRWRYRDHLHHSFAPSHPLGVAVVLSALRGPCVLPARRIIRPVGWSISRSVDQSISRSVDQSISRSVDQSISRSVDQSISRSVDQS
ncbi:MAG: hypothetical protein KDK00_14250, partial [Rhodobacteraceae bacterium]|nr:hypothetical protein [Paracoccaceae bacterium]